MRSAVKYPSPWPQIFYILLCLKINVEKKRHHRAMQKKMTREMSVFFSRENKLCAISNAFGGFALVLIVIITKF